MAGPSHGAARGMYTYENEVQVCVSTLVYIIVPCNRISFSVVCLCPNRFRSARLARFSPGVLNGTKASRCRVAEGA